MLEMCIRKALLAILIDDVVVVTPDKKIESLCRKWNIRCFLKKFEGRDVLREYYEAARKMKADTIVRLTADCPMIRPDIIDECIQAYLDNDCYIAYNTDESTGQLAGEGSDVEVFCYDVLREAYFGADDSYDREHVTSWIRKYADSYMIPTRQLGIRSVNTWEDYAWVCQNYLDMPNPVEP